MPDPAPRHWFRAKRYGYGWGLPCAWEGWVVFVGYLALQVLGVVWLIADVERRLAPYLVGVFPGSLLLVWICFKKGEPSRWRWGDDD